VFAAKQIGGPPAWDLVRDLPPLQRPVFGHLWFLYDLLLFYAAALLVVPAASRMSARVRQDAAHAFRTGHAVVGGARSREPDDDHGVAHDEHEQEPVCDRRHDEEIGSHDLADVVGQDRSPRL
jgi:hypothetical protein